MPLDAASSTKNGSHLFIRSQTLVAELEHCHASGQRGRSGRESR